MYIFISFIFFIFLFASRSKENTEARNNKAVPALNVTRQYIADSLRKTIQKRNRTLPYEKIRDSVIRDIAAGLDTPVIPVKKDESISFAVSPKGFLFILTENRYNNIREYDSFQNSLPEKDRDGFIGSKFIRKNIGLKRKFGSSSQISVTEEFQPNVPKLMFILLPLFAYCCFTEKIIMVMVRRLSFQYIITRLYSSYYCL